MSWSPGISWPFGSSATFKNGGEPGLVIVTGKRWLWSKQAEFKLRMSKNGLTVWEATGRTLQLAPEHVWLSLSQAAGVEL